MASFFHRKNLGWGGGNGGGAGFGGVLGGIYQQDDGIDWFACVDLEFGDLVSWLEFSTPSRDATGRDGCDLDDGHVDGELPNGGPIFLDRV